MIKVYTSKTCSKCPAVKLFLNQRNITFEEVDVTDNPELRQRLWDLGLTTVPVVANEERQAFAVGLNFGRILEIIK